MTSLSSYSDEQLLLELVSRHKAMPCPRSRTTRDFDFLIGIGKDNSIDISFFKDDLEALQRVGVQP